MQTFAYLRPDEMFALGGSVAGSVDATYQPAWLVDGRTGFPVRKTGSSISLTITGSATDVDALCVGHHLLDGGLSVTVGGDISTTIAIPAHPPNGIPLNGVKILGAPVSAVDSLTLDVTGNTAPAVIIGEFCAGKLRTLPRTLNRDTRFAFDDHRLSRPLDLASIPPYDKAMLSRVWEGTLLLTDTQKNDAQAWFESQKSGTRPSLIIPDTAVNDAWFVQFVGFDWVARGELRVVRVRFEEYPRSRW